MPKEESFLSQYQRCSFWPTHSRPLNQLSLILNLGMFLIEFYSSFGADSQALKADALDFLGDTANYAVSLFVLGLAIQIRAKASILKGLTMGVFGLWVIYQTIHSAIYGASPEPLTMGWVGLAALVVNLFVAYILYQFRDGDSNMQSVWLCSRNDAIGNLAVLAAAGSVAYLHSMWPDIIVAAFMSYLSITASYKVLRLAFVELKTA